MIKNHIVLLEPEIPQNTGNIARSCAATNSDLHLIHPLGFKIDQKSVKRAGLDYWDKLSIFEYANFEEFLERELTGIKSRGESLWYLTTKAKFTYSDVKLDGSCWFVFGKESAGIPNKILNANTDALIRIPMGKNIRSLNLSNSVAIVLYEALRQQNFNSLQREGVLPPSS